MCLWQSHTLTSVYVDMMVFWCDMVRCSVCQTHTTNLGHQHDIGV
jgi:hypothetical protein